MLCIIIVSVIFSHEQQSRTGSIDWYITYISTHCLTHKQTCYVPVHLYNIYVITHAAHSHTYTSFFLFLLFCVSWYFFFSRKRIMVLYTKPFNLSSKQIGEYKVPRYGWYAIFSYTNWNNKRITPSIHHPTVWVDRKHITSPNQFAHCTFISLPLNEKHA